MLEMPEQTKGPAEVSQVQVKAKQEKEDLRSFATAASATQGRSNFAMMNYRFLPSFNSIINHSGVLTGNFHLRKALKRDMAPTDS